MWSSRGAANEEATTEFDGESIVFGIFTTETVFIQKWRRIGNY